MEGLWRAYFLSTKSKVRFGRSINSFVHWLGFTTSPLSRILQVTCLLLVFAVELGAETNGIDTVVVGVPRSRLVTLRYINKTFNPVPLNTEYASFKDSSIALSEIEPTS